MFVAGAEGEGRPVYGPVLGKLLVSTPICPHLQLRQRLDINRLVFYTIFKVTDEKFLFCMKQQSREGVARFWNLVRALSQSLQD